MLESAIAMGVPLDDVAHVIMVALTPVFLLSGISSLLNGVNARLARVADQWDALHDRLEAAPHAEAVMLAARMGRLRWRLRSLDASRAFAALAGAAICAATFTLFLGALQNIAAGTVLFLLFGASILFTMASMLGMFFETTLSWRCDRRPLGTVAGEMDAVIDGD